MKPLPVLLLAVAFLPALAACHKTDPISPTPGPTSVASVPAPATVAAASKIASAEPGVTFDEGDVEPDEGIQKNGPDQGATAEPFTPEEIREYCGAVATNAQFLYNQATKLAIVRQTKTLDELIAQLNEAYQFNTGLDLTDGQRQALLATLWVNKAFVENSSLRDVFGRGQTRSTVQMFVAANEQWCQRSMRGNQPPFEFLGAVVPYVNIQRP